LLKDIIDGKKTSYEEELGGFCLCKAISQKRTKVAEKLLSLSPSIVLDVREKNGATPLSLSLELMPDLFCRLISQHCERCNINGQLANGLTILMEVSSNPNFDLDLLCVVLKQFPIVDLNVIDWLPTGETALRRCSRLNQENHSVRLASAIALLKSAHDYEKVYPYEVCDRLRETLSGSVLFDLVLVIESFLFSL
jgi:hypothetical protein